MIPAIYCKERNDKTIIEDMALRINKDTIIDPVESMYFESDDEFTDFCVVPYAVIKQSESGVYYYHGEYSDLYKKAIEEGKRFVIKDENSQVYKRQCVSKRVLVPKTDKYVKAARKDVLVQLPVDNLEPYFED